MEITDADRLKVLQMKEKKPKTVEERLQRLEDKLTILQMVMCYGQYNDSGYHDGLESLVTDDFVRIMGGSVEQRLNGREEWIGTYRGKGGPDLMSKVTGKPLDMRPLPNRVGRHLVATPVVRISDDGRSAWVTNYHQNTVCWGDVTDRTWDTHPGTYIWYLVKVGDEWKFKVQYMNSEIAHNKAFSPEALSTKKKRAARK